MRTTLSALLVAGTAVAAFADDPPANTWVDIDAQVSAGTSAVLVYLPEQKAMWLWGPGASAVFDVSHTPPAEATSIPPRPRSLALWFG